MIKKIIQFFLDVVIGLTLSGYMFAEKNSPERPIKFGDGLGYVFNLINPAKLKTAHPTVLEVAQSRENSGRFFLITMGCLAHLPLIVPTQCVAGSLVLVDAAVSTALHGGFAHGKAVSYDDQTFAYHKANQAKQMSV